METLAPYTDFGVKGLGEGGAIAPPAAIANAVNDALRRLGVEIAVADHAAPRPAGHRGAGPIVKPARFEYECPTDTAAAIALAARSDLMVKFIAGGQSLGPMLNLRLAQPDCWSI